jgi:CRP-like cAMP-binding protein
VVRRTGHIQNVDSLQFALSLLNPRTWPDTAASWEDKPIHASVAVGAITVRREQPRNQLLVGLSPGALSNLRHDLRVVSFKRGSVLCEAGEPLKNVYFVEAGAVSLVALYEDGTTAEMATVGREGLVGIGVLLGGEDALGQYVATLPGCALAVQATRFQSVLRQVAGLRTACETYAQAFLAHLLRNVACNASHAVTQRCARWLLMCDDQVEHHQFELTHEYLANMLGVRRSTVTVVARTLQNANLIRYRRGAITVLNRRGLEATACECYRMVRDGYDRSPTFAFGWG